MDKVLNLDILLREHSETAIFENGARRIMRYKASPDHLYSDLKDEAAILSMATGKYYGINAVGVTIWKAISMPATIEEIEEAVMSEYEVDRQTCGKEIRAFLTRMADEQLIEVLDDESH